VQIFRSGFFRRDSPGIQGLVGTIAKAAYRTMPADKPSITVWVTDDMVYTSGISQPLKEGQPAVTLEWSQYRGAGAVAFDKTKPEIGKLPTQKGSSSAATTNVKFSEPGEYILQVTAN
jgi:hypothetical protein